MTPRWPGRRRVREGLRASVSHLTILTAYVWVTPRPLPAIISHVGRYVPNPLMSCLRHHLGTCPDMRAACNRATDGPPARSPRLDRLSSSRPRCRQSVITGRSHRTSGLGLVRVVVSPRHHMIHSCLDWDFRSRHSSQIAVPGDLTNMGLCPGRRSPADETGSQCPPSGR